MMVLLSLVTFSCNQEENIKPTKINQQTPSIFGNIPYKGPYTWRSTTSTARWDKEKTVSLRNASDMKVALYQIKAFSTQGNNQNGNYNTSSISLYVKYKGSSSYTFVAYHKPIYNDPKYPKLKSVTFSDFPNIKNIESVKFTFRNLYQVKCSIWRD